MEENKELDNFIRKSIKEVGLEKPSANFNDLVLSKIQGELEQNPIFEYKPLFSKTMWFVILGVITAIFAYLILGNPDLGDTLYSFSQLNKLSSLNVLGKLPSFDVSNTFVYGILILTFFVLVQLFMIKQRFDQQYIIHRNEF